MMKKITAFILLFSVYLTAFSQNVFYIRTQNAGFWDTSWGPDPSPAHMNTVFGAGNWNTVNYETLTPAIVFNCSTRVVYMEGGDNGANIMNTFFAANAALISNWVNGGGQLLINAAPNEGGNINLGFGGVLLSYSGGGSSSASASVTVGQGGHPIFNGPFVSGSSWTGGSFAHATLSGGGITNLITGSAGIVLAEKNWGDGKVLFGTITWPIPAFQSPQPDAENLRLNMLSYLNLNLVNCAEINSVSIGQTTFCADDNLIVSYTTTPTFFGGNIFTAQLSDASGNFAAPVNIGSVVATTDGNINATIPANTLYGTGYRIRVVSDNPARVSPDNGVDITIHPKPTADFNFTLGCEGQPVQFSDASTISSGSIVSYTYDLGDGSVSNLANPVYAYPNTGTYSITLTVTSDAGCTDSEAKSLTVNDVPTADFSVSNNCNGETISFTNNSSGAISYTWKFGDGNTSNNVSPSHSYNSPGTYPVTLIAENADGCVDSMQQLVTIYPKPDADFSFVSVCPNVPLQFTNLSTVAGGSFTSEWNFGDGNTGNAHSPTNTYIFEGTYNVRLIVTSNFSCRDTSIKQVLVFPVPVADFNVQNVCFGMPSVFNNTSFIASGGITYNWDFGDGTTSGNADPVKIYNAPGNYNVTLLATSNNGCTSTTNRNTQIFQQPIAGFFTENVCFGDSMSFTNTTVGTNVSFQWSFGDGYFSAGANPKHLYNAPGTYMVQLISTNLNNCVDSFSQSVTVFPQPIVAFTGNDVCFGNAIQFQNLTTISSGTLNYVWDFGDGTTSYNPEPLKNYTSAGTYLVELLAVSNHGCRDSLAQSFNVYPQPIAGFSAANICFGDSVRFTNNSQGTGITFEWQFGDGDTDTATNPVHFYANDGIYNVQLIVTNGICSDTITKTVSVYAQPVSAFSANDVCFGNATVFTNQSSITNGLMNYLWNFGDGITSINPSPSHTYLNDGSYNVSLVAYTQNGCSNTSYLVVNVFVQPVANFRADNVCFGNAVVFQNSSFNIGNATFTWYFGDGNTSNDVAVNYFYNSPGTYTVSLVIENTDGCRDSVSKNVTVYATPVAAFSVANVCLGATSHFINQTTISNGTLSFWWDLGDGTTTTDINPNYTYDSISIYNTTLIATSNDGCADTATQVHIVFPYPVADFSANVACYGQAVSFSNTSTIAFGTMTHQWSFGDGNNSADESPAHVYNSLGVFNVKLTTTSDQGCASETQQFITVYPTPRANFATTPVCENDTLRFTNLSFISAGSLSYVWQLGDGNTSLVFEPQHIYSNLSGNIPATLIATSAFGCSDTLTKDVVIYPAPVAGFDYRNICFGESAKLVNTSTVNSGSISSVFWNFGDNEVSQQNSPEKTYATPGSYRIVLTVTSNRGCIDSVSKVIVVYALPDATIRPLGRNPFCFGDSVILSSGTLVDSFEWSTGENTQTITVNYADYFTVTVTSQHGCTATAGLNTIVYSLPPANAGNDTTISKGFDAFLNATGGTVYVWSPSETLSDANIANPVASPLETTTYTVTVTDENQCVNTDDITVFVEEDYLLLVTNVITPNNDGANDRFEIINIETYPTAELLIFDRWGTEVYSKKPYNNEWDGTYKGKNLPDGTYYYVIRFAEKDKRYKGSVSILR
jgi:gliding motility-associated-like protein